MKVIKLREGADPEELLRFGPERCSLQVCGAVLFYAMKYKGQMEMDEYLRAMELVYPHGTGPGAHGERRAPGLGDSRQADQGDRGGDWLSESPEKQDR